jgi:hypothetical protein
MKTVKKKTLHTTKYSEKDRPKDIAEREKPIAIERTEYPRETVEKAEEKWPQKIVERGRNIERTT